MGGSATPAFASPENTCFDNKKVQNLRVVKSVNFDTKKGTFRCLFFTEANFCQNAYF
jgi:hypothetical protein